MSDGMNELELEDQADLLTLVDEEGVEHQFEVVDSAEIDDRAYMALVPTFDKPEEMLDDPGELIILRIVEEDDDEYLEAIEDEAEYEKVGNFFMERLSDIFEFEDE